MANDWRLVFGGAERAVFGSHESGIGLDAHPVTLPVEHRTEDTARPRADGVAMGSDFLGTSTVELDFTIFGDSYDDARQRRNALAAAWRADAIRRKPGVLAELWSHTGRVAFGRPRRFAAQDTLLRQGVGRATADFVMADPNWYGEERSVLVPFTAGSQTGFMFPLSFPMTTTGEAESLGVVDVTGDAETPIVVEVHGPITNPIVELGPLRFEANVSLAFDESLVINGWTDVRAVTINGRASAGVLSARSTRLSQTRLEPGRYELLLRGISQSGTASVAVRWRDASASW